MLVPAAISALLSWDWWVAALLVTPGFSLYVKKSWAAANEQGVRSPDETGQRIISAIAAPIAVILADVVRAHAGRFSILVLVGYLIVVADPLGRIVWHLHSKALKSHAPTGA